MGQGGSISENKSFILSNWVQTKPNSNIFYNKVTNQQIQRHEVLINDRHQLSSYNTRMHDQSLLICRLIYFHPKSTPKDDVGKKHHTKQPSNELIQQSNRAKSMLKQHSQLNIQYKSSPKNVSSTSSQQPKVYCVYTDRMIPVKEWNKDKIIDVIEAFRKLTQVYGFFKVREGCICENQRKEVKIWTNENPVSNFIVERVDTEEDMIADLAAVLVSKKEKIAKELLDLQYFAQAIEHFSKLNDYDLKKYNTSTAPGSSIRSPGFPASNRESQTSQPSFGVPEVNNFYNVFINTENSYTVSSSLQNSKYNLINKGSFGYPYYAPKGESWVPGSSKEGEKEETVKKQADKNVNMPEFKATNDAKMKREYSSTEYAFPSQISTLVPVNSNLGVEITEEKELAKHINPQSQSSSINNISYSTIGTKDSVKKANQEISHPVHTFGQRDLTENTSIMINAKKDQTLLKNGSLDKQKDRQHANRQHNFHLKYMVNSEKKTPVSVNQQNLNLYSTQTPKSTVLPKFTPSTQQQIKNRSKNNSDGDIANKGDTAENAFVLDSFGAIKKETTNSNAIESTRAMVPQRQFFSNGSVQKPASSLNNYFTSQSNSHTKPVSSFQQKIHENNKNSSWENTKKQASGDIQTKSFIRTEYNPAKAGQKSKVFIKSYTNDQQRDLMPNYNSTRNFVSQMSTLKPPNSIQQNPTLANTLSKKSFPKYLQEKQSAKSIQKYYEKSLEQREKSRALIGKVEEQMSPQKLGFGGEGFKYQQHRMQDIVAEVSDGEACGQEMIPPSNWQQAKIMVADNQLKLPIENYEPRRKFPSTTQVKPKKVLDMRQFEQMQCKKSRQGTEVDSQQSDNHLKLNLTSQPILKQDKMQQLKKPPNKGDDEGDNKSCIMTKSYFSYMNTNNSVLVGNAQHDKQQFKSKAIGTEVKKDVKKVKFDMGIKEDGNGDGRFKFKNLEQKDSVQSHEVSSHGNQSSSGPFSKLEEKQSMNFEEPKSRESMVQVEEKNTRNQSFPYAPGSVLRKNEKQFTFFSSNQKPTGVGNIEQIRPFEVSHTKIRGYAKKQSIKSVDEQQTLPRTTTDQRQKRLFRQTRVSEVLIDTEELHRSDPGHKIEQIVGRIEKQKEALMRKNGQQQSMEEKLSVRKNGQQQSMEEKLDAKQYPVFKKWEPSMNVFGSVINQHSYNSCAKKKEYAKSQQEGAEDKLSLHDSQKDDKACPSMVNSQNLQTKKKIRKQVFMDYKGLFGDENPFQKEETAEQRERARRLQVKRQREEEERLLENASSKDLLIQEKVQKQKEKHAQLKNDLSKLFTEG